MVGKDHEEDQVQHQPTSTMLTQCHISTALEVTSRDGNSTTPLGSLFHCITALSEMNFSLIPNLNIPWCNLRLLPLVLSLLPGSITVTWEQRLTPTSLQPPFRTSFFMSPCPFWNKLFFKLFPLQQEKNLFNLFLTGCMLYSLRKWAKLPLFFL